MSRRSTILWIASALLLAYSAVIAATGGVNLVIAGLRLRSRTWERPALIGLACLAVVAIVDRRRAARVTGRATSAAVGALTRVISGIPPLAVGVTATAWTLAAGLTFCTYTAGGADSSGYLNQAQLFARGRAVDDVRVTPTPPWRGVEFKLAPLGFRPSADRRGLSPTYPPGYPLLMVPAIVVNLSAAYLVVPLSGALAVWLTFALARRLGEPLAGAAAALLLSVSPTFLYQLVQPMSDVPVTAAWLLAMYLAIHRTISSAVLCGLTVGVASLIRPNLIPLAPLVWVACALSDRSSLRWRRTGAAIAFTIPALLALGLIQAARYGSALRSGYGPLSELFEWANVGPNLARYPRWMFETHTPLIALFVVAPLWIAWYREQSRLMFLLLWTFALAVVVAYLPYVYFQTFEWTYTRFLLPAIPLMWLLVAVPVAWLAKRAHAAWGTLLAVPILLFLIAFSLYVAESRYAFELRTGERKYLLTGEYVQYSLPRNSILISMQHSGSLWFYTDRPIVRWDYLEPGRLDEALDWMSTNGYAPFIVVDREEFERMRERFGPAAQRALERARPVATFGDATIYEISEARRTGAAGG